MAVKSFTIYEEYYDLITLLDREEQKELIMAITEYMFKDIKPDLNDKQQKIFNNLKRPLDISKNRSKSGSNTNQNKIKIKSNENQKENKLKSNQNQNEIKSKTHQDVNVNVNVNNNIYSYYENIYARTLNVIEYETITKWLETKSEDEIKRAIDETAKAGIDNLKYVEKVLYGSKKKNKKVIPEWFDKDIPDTEGEEDKEFKDFLEEFRES